MADKKISDLTALGTTPAAADVFPLVDITASETKKVTYTNSGIPANTVHRGSNGNNHSNVVLNNTHRGSNGQNHSDVVLNNSHRVVVAGNPHSVTKANVGLGSVDNVSMKEHTLYLPPINGNGFAIQPGMRGYYIVPFNCTITGAGVLTDLSCTLAIDLWKGTYANYDAGSTHPVNADSITAAAPISITTAVKNKDTTLTDWTKTLLEGDILAINFDANDNAKLAFIFLEVTRT